MINSVTLKNYRSYTEGSFEFGDGVTIIIGPNASGKTNLLESVYLVATGLGFRSSDKDLIAEGSEWCRIDSLTGGDTRVIKLTASLPRTQKVIELNDTKKSRLSFDESIPVVLFEPDDARIIGGSPERRRLYIDTLLSSISPGYKKHLASYKRALKQRNNLLKGPLHEASLFAWNTVLARHAQEVVMSRIEAIDKINERITPIYSALASTNSSVEISYESNLPFNNYLQAYLHRLERSVNIDRERGFTSTGPHRDDLQILLNGKVAGDFASRGESRSITLALKTIELEMVADHRNQKPILLLDDVFSELDGARRRMLTQTIGQYQSIITTTDADIVGKKFTSLATLISL